MKTLRMANTDLTALVDDEDWDLVRGESWRCLKNRRDGRAHKFYAQNGQGRLLHRIILMPDTGVLVDHIDGDGLNCQRHNMRLATRSQNAMNRGPQTGNPSGYKGVYPQKGGSWVAKYKLNQKSYVVGSFATAEAAHAALAPVRAAAFGAFDYAPK